MNYWSLTMPCQRCAQPCRYLGMAARTDYFCCRACGADHAVDHVSGKTTVVDGESDVQRFAAALAKHKGLIAPGGLP